MHPRAVPSPKLLSTGMPHRSGRLLNPNWWAALNRSDRKDLRPDKIQDQVLQDRLSALAPVRQGAKGTCPNVQPVPSARERPRGLELDRVVRLAPVETHWSLSASRSVETAAEAEAKVAVLQEERVPHPAATVQPCHPACANRSHPVSSCSSRNLPDVQVFPRRDGPTAPLSPREETVRKQLRRSPARRPLRHRRRQPQDAPAASGPAPVLEGSAAPVVLIGMTAPSWTLCATVHRRSNAKKFTSLARTTIPWLHRPGDSPANRKTWCCRPAWRAHPSRNPSRSPHRNRWRPCASAARKPRGSASGGGPWSCGRLGRRSR